MLALGEKVRTVVVFTPEVVLAGQEKTLLPRFADRYLEVKARKQVYLTKADAESFYHYLPAAERDAAVAAVSRGSCEVMAFENLDGDVVERTIELVEEFTEFSPGAIYCSAGPWQAMRDLEFFFPHLDQLPVERTLALIKADGLSKGQKDGLTLEQVVESEVASLGLCIVGKRQMALKHAEAEVLCADLKGTADLEGSMGVLLADPGAIAMVVEGRGAVRKWLLCCGPTNAGLARDYAPTTIRARWGTDSSSNAIHGSSSMESADKEIRMLFPPGTLKMQRTLCVVKPDAMANLLQIRAEIEEGGFTILKEKQTLLTEDRAKEFYRDYKDKPFFSSLIKHACSGPCCILVLCRLEAVAVWQQMMGPETVKDARRLFPRSLRARYGRDGQRNALHGSSSAKSAGREVRFFFPELGADPYPDDNEVRDFLFRKSAVQSMDLKSLSDIDTTNMTVDPTMQQLLSKGLMALCQVQPKGLAAVKWLSRWLTENNPNKKPDGGFNPPDRPTKPTVDKRYISHGINQDGMPFAVEAPLNPEKKKQVIDVDVSEEVEAQRISDLSTPPFVVFVLGGPGVGKGTQCAKLREDFNLVHLKTADLLREEVAAQTYLGTEIYKHMQNGTPVADSIIMQLLKKTMVKYQDTNRFLLDGFPKSVEQVKRFEQEIAEVAFVLYFEASEDTMKARCAGRLEKMPERLEDKPEKVEKNLAAFNSETLPVTAYYGDMGKLRKVDAEQPVEEVYGQAKKHFSCRFIYLMGPPGAPISALASRLEAKYGYAAIDMPALHDSFAKSEDKEAEKVKQSISKGKAVDASISCPLLLSEIYRDMALGVQNFVICDFPQSKKQAEFLEYRIPSVAKPLLLDFSRADAEDLAVLYGRDPMEGETRVATLFGEETQQMLKSLSGLQRIPCSLAELDRLEPEEAVGSSVGLAQKLEEACWDGICERVMPGVTIVLGPPCSGTEVLAQLLSALTPNTYAVDCDQLLDKELERRTEIGITMHNMLARGQVVPLSMTLELLKSVVGLTCSDSIVMSNLPTHVDQIEYLSTEFRIDRVFYIRGSEKAVASWKEAYLEANKSDNPSREARVFDERLERLEPIVTYFSRIGKLERLDVNETPKEDKLKKMIQQATMPQFAVVTGLSNAKAAEQAQMLATAYGAGPVVSMDFLVEWAKKKLTRGLDPNDPAKVLSALRQYADGGSFPLLVLDRYPCTTSDAAAFLEYFGAPKVLVNMNLDDEARMEEYKAEHEGEDINEDELPDMMEKKRAAHDAMIKAFMDECPEVVMPVDLATVKAPEELSASIRRKLLPKVYAVVGPAGRVNLSGLIANGICTSRSEGRRPTKFTVIDANALFKSGKRSKALEDKLVKASFTADTPDNLPAPLWAELFQEAFAQSPNPMGTFLVTNFPTPCCLRSSPTIRDQFFLLETICTFMGILNVSLTDGAFNELCAKEQGDLAQYLEFSSKVKDSILVQYPSSKICDCIVDSTNPSEATKKVVADFLAFKDKAEVRA
eukprot:gnl/TRDRNA2_/TRDRNA2_178467_c0_seq1.p1 gnl/TRDRNA2_/TRDRNA2_178467_c0~~gnl/TRDRNA2_/TRDRNA2_178467_c0_seq1.p1  ORF type:complete len:1499 (-),score=413.44 gnl/TRDRNA2_/TRDRNA2_178467_c0_seq1:56-4552(-)